MILSVFLLLSLIAVGKDTAYAGISGSGGLYCGGTNLDTPFKTGGKCGKVSNLYLFDCDFSAATMLGGGIAAANKITGVSSLVKTRAGKTFRIKSKAKENAKQTYKLLTKSAKKYFKVASNGTVTVKKGVKKGLYKIQVQITAKETGNYKATTVKKTIKIRVQ